MNYNKRSKSKRNESDDEENSRESFYKQKFYETLSQAENEAKIKNDEDINKRNSTETEQMRKKLSLKMMKVIYSRKLQERKKLFLNKWKEKILIHKRKEKKFKKFLKILEKILIHNKFKKIKTKSQFSLKILKFLDKLTYLFKKKRKLFTLRFFLNLKNCSTNLLLRIRVYKNLINHLYFKKRKDIIKSKLTQWILIVNLIKQENLSNNLNKFQNTLKKIYSNFFFTLLKKIFLFEYRQKKLSYLIKKKLIYKNFKQWDYLVDKNLIYGKIRRKNIQTAKVKKIMKRLFTKNNEKLKIQFIRWVKQTIKQKFLKPARIIQKFMQFANLRKNKWICVKTISRQYKALNRLFNFFNLKIYSIPFNKIKYEYKRRILINFVINLKKKKLENFLCAWDKIQNFAKIKFLIRNTSAMKIQSLFKRNFIQSKIWKLIEKIRFLRNILKDKISNKELRNRFMRWKIIITKISRKDDSKTIQKYFKNKINKLRIEKKFYAIKNLNKLFLDFFLFIQLKPFFKKFVKSQIIKNGVSVIEKCFFRILIHRSKNLIQKNFIFKFFKVLSLIRKKNLFDSFLNLKSYSEIKSRHLTVLKIQRNFRWTREKVRRKDLKTNLLIILNRTNQKNKNVLKHALTNWKRNLINYKMINCAIKISEYVKKKWIKNKWKKFYQKINLRENAKILRRLAKSLNNFRKLFALLNTIILRKLFKDFGNFCTNLKKDLALKKFVFNFNKRENLNRIKSVLGTWMKKIKNFKKTEFILNSLLKIQKKLSFFIFGLSLKFKFFEISLKNLKKKNLLKILKNKANNQKTFETFGLNIIKHSRKIEMNSKLILREKIYKLFTYKILSTFIKLLQNKFSSITLKPAYNKFLKNMFSLLLRKSFFEGRKKLFNKKEGNSKIFKFHSNDKKNIRNNTGESQISKIISSTYSLHATRALIRVLTFRDQDKLQKFFDFYKMKFLLSKLQDGILKLEIMQLIKKSFFKKLWGICKLYEKRENLKDDFYIFMRKFSIHKIKKISKQMNRISKLMYFINVIQMQKNVSRLLYKKEIFRQLAFQCNLNKFSRRKLSSLYKSFYLNYLETSSYLFNDQELKLEYDEIRKRMIGNNFIKFASHKNEEATKTETEIEKFY